MAAFNKSIPNPFQRPIRLETRNEDYGEQPDDVVGEETVTREQFNPMVTVQHIKEDIQAELEHERTLEDAAKASFRLVNGLVDNDEEIEQLVRYIYDELDNGENMIIQILENPGISAEYKELVCETFLHELVSNYKTPEDHTYAADTYFTFLRHGLDPEANVFDVSDSEYIITSIYGYRNMGMYTHLASAVHDMYLVEKDDINNLFEAILGIAQDNDVKTLKTILENLGDVEEYFFKPMETFMSRNIRFFKNIPRESLDVLVSLYETNENPKIDISELKKIKTPPPPDYYQRLIENLEDVFLREYVHKAFRINNQAKQNYMRLMRDRKLFDDKRWNSLNILIYNRMIDISKEFAEIVLSQIQYFNSYDEVKFSINRLIPHMNMKTFIDITDRLPRGSDISELMESVLMDGNFTIYSYLRQMETTDPGRFIIKKPSDDFLKDIDRRGYVFLSTYPDVGLNMKARY